MLYWDAPCVAASKMYQFSLTDTFKILSLLLNVTLYFVCGVCVCLCAAVSKVYPTDCVCSVAQEKYRIQFRDCGLNARKAAFVYNAFNLIKPDTIIFDGSLQVDFNQFDGHFWPNNSYFVIFHYRWRSHFVLKMILKAIMEEDGKSYPLLCFYDINLEQILGSSVFNS